MVPIGLIAMVGVLALVVNAGLMYMIRSEMQNAADAAALAAVWYPPVCQDSEPLSPPTPPAPPPQCGDSRGTDAVSAGQAYFAQNTRIASGLCVSLPLAQVSAGANAPSQLPPNYVVVSAICTANVTFGSIFSIPSITLKVNAVAALCDAVVDAAGQHCIDGNLTSITPQSVLSTRLVQ